MSEQKIICGDCLEVMKQLPDNSVDAVVTDPPYHLIAPSSGFERGNNSQFTRMAKGGFMGKAWDGGDIAFKVETWKEVLRVLRPGGHLLSFGGTRTYHRMAVAIEDAGFEVRDMIEWVYGSGFPKSLNIGKAVNKLQGNEREVVGIQMLGGNAAQSTKEKKGGTYASNTNAVGVKPIEVKLTKGTSEWEGWGTALKPAHELICMARKPLSEKTVAENVLKWGTGGINIDESRVGTGAKKWSEPKGGIWNESVDNGAKLENNPQGRFPANLIHDNSEEVRECFPDESARFFKSIIYTAKASKSERNKGCEGLEEKKVHKYGAGIGEGLTPEAPSINRNNHPTVKPIALMEYLIKMVTPKGGIVLDPFAGSGSTLVAAQQNGFQYIGIELEADYVKIAEARLRQEVLF